MPRTLTLILAWISLTLAFSSEPAQALHGAQTPSLGVQRLQLTGTAAVQPAAAESGSAIEWSDLEQDGATDDWILGDTKLEVLPNGPQQVRAIHHPETSRVVLPASIQFRDTPRLTLDLIVRGKSLKLRVELLREGKVQRETEVQLETASETQHVVLNFDSVPAGVMTCDRIALIFPAGPFPVGIVGVRIEDAAIGGSIPAGAFGGVAMIGLGNESRPGTCLSDRGDLSCEFQVGIPNQRLRFSYATPKSVMTGGAQPNLKVTVSADGVAPEEVLLPFLEKPGAQPTWQTNDLALGAFVGKLVRATFHLEVGNSKARLAALGVPELISPQSTPTSVLLITADSHRADHLSLLGGDGRPETKTLDTLATQGVAFLSATSGSNGRLRSHQILFSGAPLAGFDLSIAHGEFLAQKFAKLGYATYACVGAGDLDSVQPGFDRFSSPGLDGRRSATDSIQDLTRWIESAKGVPLFAWVHLSEARGPYTPPTRIIERYYPEDIDPFDVTSPVSAFEFAPTWNPLIGDPFYTEALYDGSITHLDEQLAKLMRVERFAAGVIAYVGAHGENLRKAGENRFGQQNLTASTLAVPLMIKAPQLEVAKHNQTPVATADLGRTLLHLAGHANVQFPGNTLTEVAQSDDASALAIQGDASTIALVNHEWILRVILSAESPEDLHRTVLFRRATDPNCLTDLADEQATTTAQLRSQLLQRISQESARGGASPSVELDPDCSCANCESFR